MSYNIAMEKRKVGRPTKYSSKIADEICDWLASGQTLTSYCKIPGNVCYQTVMYWIWHDSEYRAEFSEKYAKAREMQAEKMADEITDIADDDSQDYEFKESEDGTTATPVFLKENVQRSRLRVDSRKWIASKLLPKKYGERITTQHEGGININCDLADRLAEALDRAKNGTGKAE